MSKGEAQEVMQGVTNHSHCKEADLTSLQPDWRMAFALVKHLSEPSGSTHGVNVSPQVH